jgi:hypothetical protein
MLSEFKKKKQQQQQNKTSLHNYFPKIVNNLGSKRHKLHYFEKQPVQISCFYGNLE